MIKKIAISELKIGMYVHDLSCSWLKHPFAVSQFKVTSEEEIRKIQSIGISHLYIDTEKEGADAEPETESAESEMSAQRAVDEAPTAVEEAASAEARTVALEQELAHAVRIKREAVQLISDIMEDVEKGKPISMSRVNPVVEGMVASVLRNSDALLGLARIRQLDKYTFEHSAAVSVLLIAFGNHLGLDEDELVEVGVGGLLMDVGKARVPPYILHKPAKLTDREFKVVTRHVMHSQDILEKTAGVSTVSKELVADHHERIDGSGYLLGKRGDDISFYGKMAAIVDVYDALSTDRIYKQGVSPHVALKQLMEWGGVGFEQDLVQRFVQCMGIYPHGTLVSLSNGQLAIVVEASTKGLLSPKVRVIFDTIKRYFVKPETLDLSIEGEEIKIVGVVEAGKWGIQPEEFMGHVKY
jgi:HD-GYP domain-containing protein (c-di-GMP phosphodiesterase class II)